MFSCFILCLSSSFVFAVCFRPGKFRGRHVLPSSLLTVAVTRRCIVWTTGTIVRPKIIERMSEWMKQINRIARWPSKWKKHTHAVGLLVETCRIYAVS
jgi:hypothetical protein